MKALQTTPKGLRPPAQGCEATLCYSGRMVINPNGVEAIIVSGGPQPRWGWIMGGQFSQGSSCLATLGYEPESRWDSLSARSTAVRPFHHSSFCPLPWTEVLAARERRAKPQPRRGERKQPRARRLVAVRKDTPWVTNPKTSRALKGRKMPMRFRKAGVASQ